MGEFKATSRSTRVTTEKDCFKRMRHIFTLGRLCRDSGILTTNSYEFAKDYFSYMFALEIKVWQDMHLVFG